MVLDDDAAVSEALDVLDPGSGTAPETGSGPRTHAGSDPTVQPEPVAQRGLPLTTISTPALSWTSKGSWTGPPTSPPQPKADRDTRRQGDHTPGSALPLDRTPFLPPLGVPYSH